MLLLIASTSQAFEFSSAVPCNEAEVSEGKQFQWCIGGHFPANEKVAFLDRSQCRAKTAEHRRISSSIEEYDGTALKNFKCVGAENGDKVVLGIDVKQYRKLAMRSITDSKFSNGIDARIRASATFLGIIKRAVPRPQFTNTLKLHLFEVERSTADSPAYFAAYKSVGHEDQLLFLVTNKEIQGITEGYWECPGPSTAFRLNGSDVFEISICTCGTDECSGTYLGIPH